MKIKLCISLLVVLLIALTVAVVILLYEDKSAAQTQNLPSHDAELAYKTTKQWQPYPLGRKHQKNGVQYNKSEDGIILRKVYLEEEKKIYIYGKDIKHAHVFIMFHVACEENSVIETREKFADGSPMVLSCLHQKTGSFLSIALVTPYDATLNYDFGGFRVNEDLSTWGLDPIIREFTLKTARKPLTVR